MSKNPAKALYNFWYSVLDGCLDEVREGKSIAFGSTSNPRGSGIGAYNVDQQGRPILGFGYVGYGFAPLFTVRANGDFSLPHRLTGYKMRDAISRSTFLTWRHYRGAYNWLYWPTKNSGKYSSSELDWRDQRFYVTDKLLTPSWHESYYGIGSNGIKETQRWWSLVPDDQHDWRIAPSKSQPLSEPAAALYERWVALVDRRHRLAERDYRIMIGELPPRPERHVLSDEEREARFNDDAQALSVLLDVTAPAKTTPMRRTPVVRIEPQEIEFEFVKEVTV